ncbi:MAG: hypothetical protein H6943_10210 [Zoogloeaceae bacterium]|nr:hypothetical protein [Zoogloeaceae bacterium]
MKKHLLAALVASMALSFSAQADVRHHRGPMHGMSASVSDVADSPVKSMQTNLRRMIVQLDRVSAAKTDQERQKAVADYMQTAQENMMLGHALYANGENCPMMGEGMMPGGMMHGGMMYQGAGQPGKPAVPADRLQMMEQRMDRMQIMMEHMMRRSEGAPASMPQAMPMR